MYTQTQYIINLFRIGGKKNHFSRLCIRCKSKLYKSLGNRSIAISRDFIIYTHRDRRESSVTALNLGTQLDTIALGVSFHFATRVVNTPGRVLSSLGLYKFVNFRLDSTRIF